MTTASNVSTRARGWVMLRADSVLMGFTDHDRALTFLDPVRGAVTLEPSTGFTASAFAESVGLGNNDMDIEGALSSDRITMQDLSNGVYDGAEVRFYWIDWSDTANFDLISVNRIAEIKRNQDSFSATIEGLAAKAGEPVGLRLTRECGLEFGGDVSLKTGQGCGIDLSGAAYSQSGVISRVISERSFAVTGLTLAAGLCTFGSVSWSSGLSSGGSATVKSHTVQGSEAIFELDLKPKGLLALGDGFTAVAGCDKSKGRCASFGNIARRLAFPVPANNVATKYARDLAAGTGGGSGQFTTRSSGHDDD